MTDAPAPADAPPAASRGRAAPAVVAVVVTHDPGPWFEEVLRSLAAQTYEQLSILVVDAGSVEDPTPRVAAVLPDARVRRLAANPGFGAAANTVLGAVEGAAFHLVCHDDIALEPGAVRHLVEEAFRTNGGVLGPKLVDWHQPRRIRSVGGSVDKTGAPAPAAEPGELDQEQHDAVRDVFYLSGGALLIRADLFATLGGFDPGMPVHGDDVDLCWRAHIAGARVVMVPEAVGRHLEALGERRPVDDRRRLQQRHRVRSLLSCYGLPHLARVLPQALVFTLVEAVFALVNGRTRHARDLVGAWTWNLRHWGGIRRRRRALRRVRRVHDAEVRGLQVRGSARLTAFLRGQLGHGDSRLTALAATGRGLSAALRAPLSRVTVTAAAVTLLLMALGTRNLLFQPLPAVGDLAAFPDSPLDLLREHLRGWRATAGGGWGPAATVVGTTGLAGFLPLGVMGAARKLLILGLLPAGPIGIARLTRPIGSIRATAAAVVVYAAIPVPHNALASGSWSALAVYAVLPWVVLGLARTMGLAPFGSTDLSPETAAAVATPATSSLARRVLGLGLALALGALVAPAVVPLVGLVAVGLLVGSLVAGRVAGLARLVVTAAGGAVVAVVLHLPWSYDLLASGAGWSSVVDASGAPPRPVGELLRFQTGPFGNSPLGWAFLGAAALPLVIGRGWRWAWAVRAWFVALAGWGALVAAGRGWVPIDLPAAEVLLVPAAVALALSAALGMAAFEVDLRHYRFGWRQGVSVSAALAVVVGGLTIAPGVIDGRWNVPRADLNRVLAPVLAADGAADAEVLWLGRPDLLPLGSHLAVDGVALATSRGLPDLTTRGPVARHAATDRLVADVRTAVDRRTAHLGGLLAPQGVRYVIVPRRSVPSAYGGRDQPPPLWLLDTLAAQVDLEQVDTDPSLLVYRNAALAPDSPVALPPEDRDRARHLAGVALTPLLWLVVLLARRWSGGRPEVRR